MKRTIGAVKKVNPLLLAEELELALPHLQLGYTLNIMTWGKGWTDRQENELEIEIPNSETDERVARRILLNHSWEGVSKVEEINLRNTNLRLKFARGEPITSEELLELLLR